MMKILTIDIGTGTQDIFLYDSQLDIENGFKLVVPSPTMIVHRQVKAATQSRTPILLTGVMMGGGPSAWAVEAHARARLPIYATPPAARTLNDELDKVQALGIQIVSDDEAAALGAAYAAGLAVGFWKNFDELRANWGRDKEWQPQMDEATRSGLYVGWKKAVTRTFDWI